MQPRFSCTAVREHHISTERHSGRAIVTTFSVQVFLPSDYIIPNPSPGLGSGQLRPPPHLRGTSPAGRSVPVYVTVSRCDEPGDPTAELLPSFTASYWTFHPFSEGKRAVGRLRGSHVGDWEHVSLMVQVRVSGRWGT